MGSMSASDAAPLPRLGEVYFDVRGESRSMRLSWYADTGVAVFSIWQGGTCTGTFRLPIADLPRMVEALQRGPHGGARGPRDAGGTAEQHGRGGQRGGRQRGPGPEPDTGYSDPGLSAAYADHPAAYGEEPPQDHHGDRGGEHRRTGAHGRYDDAEARQGYGDDSVSGGYRSEPRSGYPPSGDYADEPTGVYHGDLPGHGYRDDPGARYREPDYPDDPLTGRYPVQDPDDPLTGRYPVQDPHPSRYQDDPLTGPYHEDPHPSRSAEDPLTGDYPDSPDTGDYPTGPATGGYSGDSEGEDHPASPGNAGVPPARPYVAPVRGGAGPAAEGRGHRRRRAADPEESDLSPDSFPYGRPPAEPEPRRHGR